MNNEHWAFFFVGKRDPYNIYKLIIIKYNNLVTSSSDCQSFRNFVLDKYPTYTVIDWTANCYISSNIWKWFCGYSFVIEKFLNTPKLNLFHNDVVIYNYMCGDLRLIDKNDSSWRI